MGRDKQAALHLAPRISWRPHLKGTEVSQYSATRLTSSLLRGWRLTLAALVILLAALGATAQASSASPVVPPGGTVAGEGYSHWLGVKNQVFFDSGGAPPACGTSHAPGGRVALLSGEDAGRITCDEPAGRPIYVDGVSNECSTFAGDHKGFGVSPSQLRRCARAGFAGLSGTARVDGVPVADYRSLITATGVVPVHLPPNNAFGIPPGRGDSADYGEGLLLKGFAPGRHTITITSTTPGGTHTADYTLTVY